MIAILVMKHKFHTLHQPDIIVLVKLFLVK